MSKAESDTFVNGYLAALQFVAMNYDESIVEYALQESGFSKDEIVKSQDESDYGNDVMFGVIERAFE